MKPIPRSIWIETSKMRVLVDKKTLRVQISDLEREHIINEDELGFPLGRKL